MADAQETQIIATLNTVLNAVGEDTGVKKKIKDKFCAEPLAETPAPASTEGAPAPAPPVTETQAVVGEPAPPVAGASQGGRRRSKRRSQKKPSKKSKKGGRSRKNSSKNRRKYSRRR